MRIKDSIDYKAERDDALATIEYLNLEIERLKDELFFYACECVMLGKKICQEGQRKSDHCCGWRASQALRARIPDTLGD